MDNKSLPGIAALVVATLSPSASAQTTTFNVTNSGMTAYIINSQANPTLTLTRGQTYTFNVNTPGHPFDIKTVQGAGTANQYNVGVSAQGVTNGTLTFNVAADAPATLWYQCEIHNVMSGQLLTVAPAAPAVGGYMFAAVGAILVGLGAASLYRRRGATS